MISRDYVILAAEGMHARPATALVRLVKKFKSNINLKKEDKLIKLNSMLNILSMGAKGGESITVLIDGEDEIDAATALDDFFIKDLKTL